MAHVLVAEDNAALRQIIVDALQEAHYTVDATGNGREALELFAARRPDVVVLDLMLPALDGWAFVEQVHSVQHQGDVPIIVISAAEGLFERTAQLPVRVVLSKPFRLETLLEHVARLSAPTDTP